MSACDWCGSTTAVERRKIADHPTDTGWARVEIDMCGACWGESEREREWSRSQ